MSLELPKKLDIQAERTKGQAAASEILEIIKAKARELSPIACSMMVVKLTVALFKVRHDS